MKKLALLVLALCLLSSTAFSAPIDLSVLSFDDLVALRNEVFAEIVRRDEFKEVKVPSGEYRIGVDIPAGEYSLTTKEIMAMIVVNEYNMNMLKADEGVGRLVLKDGDEISIVGAVTFSTYAGLGF